MARTFVLYNLPPIQPPPKDPMMQVAIYIGLGLLGFFIVGSILGAMP